MPLTAPGLTLQTYTEVLRLLLPVLRSWEDWAVRSAPAAVRPLLAARRRSQWIEQDLLALGEVSTSLRQMGKEPIRWSDILDEAASTSGYGASDEARTAAFLGAFYVLEGSTLGGRFIARHVEEVLKLEPGQGDAYFRGHEEHTGAMWRETTAAIAAVPEEHSGVVIDAAKRTFRAFGAVLGTLQPAVTSFVREH